MITVGKADVCPTGWNSIKHMSAHVDGTAYSTCLPTRMGQHTARVCPQGWDSRKQMPALVDETDRAGASLPDFKQL